LNPPAALEAGKHKLKRLVQSPNSFFMDVKCQGCFKYVHGNEHAMRCDAMRPTREALDGDV